MYLTIRTPVTVSSWATVLTSIPTEDRCELDLEHILEDVIDPDEFISIPIKSQKNKLADVFCEHSLVDQIVDQILVCTSSAKVWQSHVS